MDVFDYVIVGAGAAGCLLANRLTEDGRTTVCVLEAGPPDRNFYIHLPAGFIKVGYDPKYTWPFRTQSSEGTAGRRILTTQGRTLGGSSAINGFNYTRGQPADYDTWAGMGNPGWGYADVLPYFKRTEHRIGQSDPRYRGQEGLLPITDCDWRHPLCDAFIEGAASAGLPKQSDYNAEKQTSTGYYQRWIENGWRVSAASAFLRPAMKRANLDVRTNAHATAILLEGKRATGVEYASGPGAASKQVRARREVILTAGAANTPKLMQLSGIGPASVLDGLGIGVKRDLRGIGENLRDHMMVRSIVQVKGVETLNSAARGWRLLREIAKWALKRPSILAISPSVAYAFCRADLSTGNPDLQFHFSPGSYASGIAGKLDAFPGMTLGFYQLRPTSSGFVRARSSNPFDDPAVQPNYLSTEEDRRLVVAALRLTRRFLRTPALAKYSEREVSPLRPAEDAIIIHTDHLSLDEVVEKIMELVAQCRS